MHKLAALAATVALGVAGMGYTKPAEARGYGFAHGHYWC